MIVINKDRSVLAHETFEEIFPDFDTFKQSYIDNGGQSVFSIEDTPLRFIYLCIAQRYAGNQIANASPEVFKLKFTSRIAIEAPNFLKTKDVYDKIRSFTDEELQEGGVVLTNTASNPSRDPSVDADEPLPYMDNQTYTKSKYGNLDLNAKLLDLLDNSYIDDFLSRFQYLFMRFVPKADILYTDDDDGQSED